MEKVKNVGIFLGKKGQNGLWYEFLLFYWSCCNYYFGDTRLKNAIECSELNKSHGSLEDAVERNVNCGHIAHEVLEDGKNVINNQTMGHCCDILAKNCDHWSCWNWGNSQKAVVPVRWKQMHFTRTVDTWPSGATVSYDESEISGWAPFGWYLGSVSPGSAHRCCGPQLHLKPVTEPGPGSESPT